MEHDQSSEKIERKKFLTHAEIAALSDLALREELGLPPSLTATPRERQQDEVLLRMQQRLELGQLISTYGKPHESQQPFDQASDPAAPEPKIHPSLLDDNGDINPAYYQYFIRH